MRYNVSGIGKIKEDIWFTSDTRFCDSDALHQLARPFRSTDEMNDYIIDKWNTKVNRRDIVYHVGNFGKADPDALKDILNKLNGRINLIVGSYDNRENILSIKHELASVNYRLDFRIDSWFITLNHFPQRFWKGQREGSIHMYGYTCGTIPADSRTLCLDIGVDTRNDFSPYNWEEIKDIIHKKRDYINFQKNRIPDYL